MTHAAERGFSVAKPWGDSARYDVSIEHNGRFLRVQVKCTDRWTGSAYSCLLHAAHQHAYTAAQIDYFAIYIVPDDIWYFFPAKKLIGQTAVALAPHKKDHKNEHHREAWYLLESRSQPRSERPEPVERPIQLTTEIERVPPACCQKYLKLSASVGISTRGLTITLQKR